MADTIQHGDNNRGGGGGGGGTTVVVTPDSPSVTGTTTGHHQNNAGGKSRRSVFQFDGLQFNIWYFRTVPGILKVIEWVIGIVCIACSSPPHISAAHWFVFVAVFCFIVTFIWACIHFFSITSVIRLPWLIIELGYTLIASLFYFIAFIVLLVETAKSKYQHPWFVTFSYDAYMTAGSFGVVNFVLYSIEALFHAKAFLDSRRTDASTT